VQYILRGRPNTFNASIAQYSRKSCYNSSKSLSPPASSTNSFFDCNINRNTDTSSNITIILLIVGLLHYTAIAIYCSQSKNIRITRANQIVHFVIFSFLQFRHSNSGSCLRVHFHPPCRSLLKFFRCRIRQRFIKQLPCHSRTESIRI